MGDMVCTRQAAERLGVRDYQINWLVRTFRVNPPVIAGRRFWRPEDVATARRILNARRVARGTPQND